MNRDIRVAAPPPKPLLVFDGDCNFCRLWIRRWQTMTADSVDYLPAQAPEIAARFPEIPSKRFETAVQLIETDGVVYSGAEAVFRILSQSPNRAWPLRAYQNIPLIAPITDHAYDFVAGHRTLFSRLTRWFIGLHVEPPQYVMTRWIFLRALGVLFFCAFVSLWTQIGGLIGHDGILPAGQFMSAIKQECDVQGIGVERFSLVPTLCWWDASDQFLKVQCAAGTALSVFLILDFAPAACLALLWLLYLSLAVVGQDFLGFQWDNLLLEAGFLAIFFAPLRLLPGFFGEAPSSRITLWLLRLLVFKLMFSSGCVKLLSKDTAWRDLTALTFHYQTQPLPTWIAWYANQLPFRLQQSSCAVMFAIELGAPFLIFGPRRIRFCGAAAMIFLQLLILLTGNYTFFNFLTIALCLLLLDDFVLQNLMPRRLSKLLTCSLQPAIRPRLWPRFILIPLLIVILSVSSFQVVSLFGARSVLLEPLAFLDARVASLRTVNSYGLFAVMTTSRKEIIVEGSDDGITWLPYEFKYKPGDVSRRPRFVEPFQPRLDWQMWFAALGDYQENPWFQNFCERLLQGSPAVLALLQRNPFPQHPPKFVRAELYDYHFTNPAERRATGAWWKREPAGLYLPPSGLIP